MESSLSLKLTDLQGYAGAYLGYGRGLDNGDEAWGTTRTAEINEVVDAAYRTFLYPQPDDHGQIYEWSFLRPVRTLALASAASTITLPDDFNGLVGETVLVTTGRIPYPIRVGGEVRQKAAEFPSNTGQPLMAEIEPLAGTGPTTGQRFQLRVWPTADQAYSLTLQYQILADKLTAARPYALGGAAHSETLRVAVLRQAELTKDNVGGGPWDAEFKRRLAASIAIDRKFKPQQLGYNGDRSDGLEPFRRDYFVKPVTVYGTQP